MFHHLWCAITVAYTLWNGSRSGGTSSQYETVNFISIGINEWRTTHSFFCPVLSSGMCLLSVHGVAMHLGFGHALNTPLPVTVGQTLYIFVGAIGSTAVDGCAWLVNDFGGVGLVKYTWQQSYEERVKLTQ